MNKIIRFSAVAAACFASSTVFAGDEDFLVATGQSKGTYDTMMANLNKYCSAALPVKATQTTGSPENVNGLLQNKFNAVWTQADVLFQKRRTSDMSNVKTLVTAHTEEVHVVAPINSGLMQDGAGWKSTFSMGKFGKKEVVIATVADLDGYAVGAVGGSVITAKIVKAELDAKFKVIEKKSNDELFAALQNGEIQAAVFVGGQPVQSLADLPADTYKLLRFTEEQLKVLAGGSDPVYSKASLDYDKLADGAVPTITTEAVIATRTYETPEMLGKLAQFRKCFADNLPSLKDKPGNHPKWMKVNASYRGKWAWYDLPTPAPTTAKK